MSWAVCPACGAVVDDAQVHADWHGRIVAESEIISGVTSPVLVDGEHWTGLPAPVHPDADEASLTRIRDRAETYRDAVAAGIGACDTYLALTAPTQAQALAQVRVLTQIARGLLIAVRAIVNLVTRHMEDQ